MVCCTVLVLVGNIALYQKQDLLADGSVFKGCKLLDLCMEGLIDALYL